MWFCISTFFQENACIGNARDVFAADNSWKKPSLEKIWTKQTTLPLHLSQLLSQNTKSSQLEGNKHPVLNIKNLGIFRLFSLFCPRFYFCIRVLLFYWIICIFVGLSRLIIYQLRMVMRKQDICVCRVNGKLSAFTTESCTLCKQIIAWGASAVLFFCSSSGDEYQSDSNSQPWVTRLFQPPKTEYLI